MNLILKIADNLFFATSSLFANILLFSGSFRALDTPGTFKSFRFNLPITTSPVKYPISLCSGPIRYMSRL